MKIEEIKNFLPTVKVKIGDQILEGHTSGRNKDFGGVTVYKPFPGIPWQTWEFSWEAIARAVNNKTFLTI